MGDGVRIAAPLRCVRGAAEGRLVPVNDPNEAMNRQVMAANQEMLRPASELVKAAIRVRARPRMI